MTDSLALGKALMGDAGTLSRVSPPRRPSAVSPKVMPQQEQDLAGDLAPLVPPPPQQHLQQQPPSPERPPPFQSPAEDTLLRMAAFKMTRRKRGRPRKIQGYSMAAFKMTRRKRSRPQKIQGDCMCGLGHGGALLDGGPQPQPLQQPPPFESPAKDASSRLAAAAKTWVFKATHRKRGRPRKSLGGSLYDLGHGGSLFFQRTNPPRLAKAVAQITLQNCLDEEAELERWLDEHVDRINREHCYTTQQQQQQEDKEK